MYVCLRNYVIISLNFTIYITFQAYKLAFGTKHLRKIIGKLYRLIFNFFIKIFLLSELTSTHTIHILDYTISYNIQDDIPQRRESIPNAFAILSIKIFRPLVLIFRIVRCLAYPLLP